MQDVEEVPGVGDLSFPRAHAIAQAVSHHRDFSVVQVLKTTPAHHTVGEVIVVDVETDAIPAKNRHGIQYRERLALYVPANPKLLVEVYALRKGFPRVLHQHQTRTGSPAHLCLHFEPVATVLRTWTPQNFLATIQWWLEQSAKDALHPADQPVEQLFFVTDVELILPWNFDALKSDADRRFLLRLSPQRPDGGQSYFLVTSSGQQAGIAPIDLTLPPMVQGEVEVDPGTLGELADTLSERGVNLATPVAQELQGRVAGGTTAGSDQAFIVILLHLPIVRQKDGPVERIERRAYLVPVGTLKLGLDLGALMSHNGKVFSDLMGKLNLEENAPWRSHRIGAMEILRGNDGQAARTQSGLSDPGVASVLIGAGAIGSALLDMWGRSGWGNWTAIDKDHIKPHNLVRHRADGRHVGMVKVDAVQQINREITQGASDVAPVCADACNVGNEAVTKPLTAAALVVDASATLEYPRLASTMDDWGRHMSAFITPSGNAAVLLAEDKERCSRLRTLEAQYYRALIRETWGKNHLETNRYRYWSGASCRDISMALPMSRIVVHAGNLAEQIQAATLSGDASIRVWERDPVTGGVDVHAVPVECELAMSFGDLTLYVDDGAIADMRALRTQHMPCETGGVLMGYYDLNINSVVIIAGLPAPPDSISTPTSFQRGVSGLAEQVAEISRRTAGIVRYIGEWHSHPPGCSATPSIDDLAQLTYLALGMAEDGLPAVSLIVAEKDLSILRCGHQQICGQALNLP